MSLGGKQKLPTASTRQVAIDRKDSRTRHHADAHRDEDVVYKKQFLGVQPDARLVFLTYENSQIAKGAEF
jgi:hypothetical protein